MHVSSLGPNANPLEHPLHGLLEAVVHARTSREHNAALALLRKAVEGLQDNMAASGLDPQLRARFRDCHLLVLRGLHDQRAYGAIWTNKAITR